MRQSAGVRGEEAKAGKRWEKEAKGGQRWQKEGQGSKERGAGARSKEHRSRNRYVIFEISSS